MLLPSFGLPISLGEGVGAIAAKSTERHDLREMFTWWLIAAHVAIHGLSFHKHPIFAGVELMGKDDFV